MGEQLVLTPGGLEWAYNVEALHHTFDVYNPNNLLGMYKAVYFLKIMEIFQLSLIPEHLFPESPFQSKFIVYKEVDPDSDQLKSMTGYTKIASYGLMLWAFCDDQGRRHNLTTLGIHALLGNAWLYCPHGHFAIEGSGKFIIDSSGATYQFLHTNCFLAFKMFEDEEYHGIPVTCITNDTLVTGSHNVAFIFWMMTI